MALIDQKTNLRSLKFGLGQASDKPGGGYSNQPYIVKPIPDYDDDGSNIFNTGGPDSLLRGGLMAPIKSVDDVSRLTQMFFDLKSPNGLLFIAKQNVLSRTSVKTEASQGAGTAGGTVNQGVYLPTSTIAQAGVNFSGTHLNLLGLNPFSPGLDNNSLTSQLANGGLVKYETAAKVANLADNNVFNTDSSTTQERNPLFDLFNLNNPLILGSEQPNPFQEFIQTLIPSVNGSFDNRLLKIWYDKQDTKNEDVNVLEYGGGPGSILGVGKTQIKFADQRTGVNNPNYLGNSLLNQDLQDFRDTTRQVYYQASDLAISASVLNVANMEYKVNRGGEKSNALTRVQNELLNTLQPQNRTSTVVSNGIVNDDTSYSELTIRSNQVDTNNPDNNQLLADHDVLSPYSLNNNLITTVTNPSESSFYLNDPPTPNIYDSLDGYTKSNSATEKYKFFTKDVKGAEGENEAMDFSLYRLANGFSVYEPALEGNTWPTNSPLQAANNSSTWVQEMLISQPLNDGKLSGKPALQDFRKPLLDGLESSTIMSLAPDYSDPNRTIENRVGLGNPGKSRDVINYQVTEPGIDLINSRPIYSNTSPFHGTVNDGSGSFGNDLCKFTIGLLKNDGSGTSNFIQFRAYIDDFSDAYSADWGDVQYVGRGDKFYNYKGFNRSISMGWTVHASSKGELIPMYKKLNYLASGLAPDYSAGGFMKGNLARLSVGGYLYNQLGIIKSITYTIPQESPWEIGVNINADGGFDSEVKELPHMIKVTGFEFVPIQYDVTRKGATKFIQLQAKSGTNWSSGMQMPDEQSIAIAKQEQIALEETVKKKAADQKAREDAKKQTDQLQQNFLNIGLNNTSTFFDDIPNTNSTDATFVKKPFISIP